MKSIVNIVNFIRAFEPRFPVDLVEVVRNQIEYSDRYNFQTTFMVQYDSLIMKEFQDLLLPLDDKYEIGFWLEFNKPLTDAAGLPWKGTEGWVWDWHTQVAFGPGYTPEERILLTDIQFEKFKEIFGYYPKSIGSWVLDAVTLKYCQEKYGVEAACLCKDQYGTDGYTFWGGYFNQAYYPSVNNSYLPAQTKEKQINMPVFRMLGSDPLYQYDRFMEIKHTDVISLEPACTDAGGNRDWCVWFFDTMFRQDALGFAYTQTGQENCFGWHRMKNGFDVQFELLAEYEKKGLVSVEKLCDSGKWFKEQFDVTPVTTVQVTEDYENRGIKAYWYDSRFYRLNAKIENNRLIIRDIHRFDENYEEFCLRTNTNDHECKFSALPVYDMLMSYLTRAFSEFEINSPDFCDYEYILDKKENTATLKQGDFYIKCHEDKIEVFNAKGAEIKIKNPMYITDVTESRMNLFFEGYRYSVGVQCDCIKYENRTVEIKGKEKIIIEFGV